MEWLLELIPFQAFPIPHQLFARYPPVSLDLEHGFQDQRNLGFNDDSTASKLISLWRSRT